MLLNIGANLANIVLNFSLIFESRTIQIFRISLRVFGAGWGVAGAAIATALSYFLAAAGMLFVMLCKTHRYNLISRDLTALIGRSPGECFPSAYLLHLSA